MEETLLSDQDYGPGHLSAPRFDIFFLERGKTRAVCPWERHERGSVFKLDGQRDTFHGAMLHRFCSFSARTLQLLRRETKSWCPGASSLQIHISHEVGS